MSDDGYLLDNRATDAGTRLEALSAIFDPWTFDHIDRTGIGSGWRCWEVGAGGPSVTRFLAGRVGQSGRVLATDIDLSRASGAAGPQVELRRHDLAIDAPPDESFDLIHARLVFVHLPDRDRALATVVGALRPGGWLVLEDADPALQPLSCLDPKTPAEDLANRLRTGFRALMTQRGVDLAYGRKLPRLLREAGLERVMADAYFPVASPHCARLETATIHLIRDQLREAGIASDEDIDTHLANVASGRLDLAQPPLISAWGRRPG